MRYGRIPNWPPVWTQNQASGVRRMDGEIGVLRYVHARIGPSNTCFLVIDYQSERFVGTLLFSDRTFCAQISDLLRGNIGRPIKEIGDLDVTHLL